MAAASKFARWTLLAVCVAPLWGCSFLDSFVPKKGETTDVTDRSKNLTVDDFRNLSELDKEALKDDDEPTVTAALGMPPIPDVAQVLAAPRAPKVANTKLVSLSVTDDVPLRDVLFELGRLAQIDIEVGPGLDKSGINLRTTDRPFNEVIERISTLANLRYTVAGNSIRVEKDLPHIKNYPIDFLNIIRSSTSGYNLTTSILAGGSSGGSSSGGGSTAGTVGNSGTTAGITAASESDLWVSLEASITEILNYSPQEAVGAEGGAATAAAPAGAVSLNRQAGVMSVRATDRQHAMIEQYLNLMTRNASAQVLIEAKVVEVSLIDQFASGVSWQEVIGAARTGGIGRLSLPTSIGTLAPDGPASGSSAGGAFSLNAGDLDLLVQATQKFGTTRTLSSPRLSAINNQQAVLTFARNEVFFKCTTGDETTTIVNNQAITVDGKTKCEASSVPIGVILNIIPSINLDQQLVTLNVRPTLTRIADSVEDPAGDSNGFVSVYPVVEVRELDSVMKVQSGGVMVIGGLMEDKNSTESEGLPGVMDLPLFGNLFKSRAEDSFKRELVIFIKATIVNPDGSSDKVDRKFYKKFYNDPRPLFPKASDAMPMVHDTLQ